MTKPITITTLKSTKSTLLKKTLIIAAAATGLIIAGAVAFAAVKPSDEDVDSETSE